MTSNFKRSSLHVQRNKFFSLVALTVICHFQILHGLKIWGPGLDPVRRTLPAQYFFIQFPSENSTNKDTGGAAARIQVTVQSRDPGSRCRVRTEVMRPAPDLVIVRYKVYFECHDVIIRVLDNGRLLVDPIQLSGTVYPDYCDCPEESFEKWMEDNECPTDLPKQMEADLGRFKSGLKFLPQLKRAEASFNNPGAFAWCHYVVKDQEMYRKCYGEHVGFSMFWDSVLSWILRRTKLPDLEFLANLGDWPLIHKKFAGIPMFSWCRSQDTQDIIFPTYDLTESSLEMLGRQSLDVLAAMGKNAPRWDDKIDQLFWKGRDSRRERLNLVKLSKKYPDLINASITNFFFYRNEMVEHGGRTSSVPFFDFFNYKYQLNIDGTVAAYRFPYLLAGNSVVLKQDSGYSEHFYPDLQPWRHYVPVNADLSNLVDRIMWAKQHDDEARQIVRNAQDYVLHHLLPHHVLCYHVQLLTQWAKLLKDEVVVREDMVRVNKTRQDTATRTLSCSCQQVEQTKQEL